MTLNAAEIEWRENLPYSLDHGDFYYSMADGLQESSYVFLEKNDFLLFIYKYDKNYILKFEKVQDINKK